MGVVPGSTAVTVWGTSTVTGSGSASCFFAADSGARLQAAEASRRRVAARVRSAVT
jgi:hypothetical protein